MQSSDCRRSLLITALAFVQLPPQTSALRALRSWLDSWRGFRWIAQGLRAEGHALSRKRSPEGGWTATLTYVGKTNLPPAAPSGLATMPTHGVRFSGPGGR
jgi:hypothetical protein